jgi:hypothetical protein
VNDLDLLLPLERRGADLLVAQTDLCPAILIRVRSKRVVLFADLEAWGLGGPTCVAVPTAAGVEIVPRGSDRAVWSQSGGLGSQEQSQADSLRHGMNECWILCWFEGTRGWDQLTYGQPCHWRGHHPERPFPHVDVPWLIVLQRRPERIEIGPDGLAFSFPDDAGTIVAMPLYGADFQPVERTRSWRAGLPDEVHERCRRWSRYLRRIPIACREMFRIDEPRDIVAVEQAFDYLSIEDDWNTPGEFIAPYPPFALLAARYGFPLALEEPPADGETATLYGPYAFRRAAKSAAYELRGLLRYVREDGTYPGAPSSPAAERAAARLRQALHDNPCLAAKTSGGYTRGLALALSSNVHALRYLADEQKPAILEAMAALLAQLLDPSNYMPLIRYPAAGAASSAAPEPIGEAVCQQARDAYKVVQANLFGLWAAISETGDWQRAKQAWPLIRRWFHLPFQTQWLSPLPARWEGLDISRALFDGTIGFARIAAGVGALEDYRLACCLFAKVCAGWFAMEQMPRYHREHQPWLFNSDADYLIWHPCRFNGYVLIANDHLLASNKPEIDGRGWASAYGRMSPTSARFWRDHLRDRADEALNRILPRCRPDWAEAGAPAVMRSYVLGESAEQLEQHRAADEAAEKAASSHPLRLRTYRLFQSTPIRKDIATIEAGVELAATTVVPDLVPMSAPEEGASRIASRMEQAAMPVRIEWCDKAPAEQASCPSRDAGSLPLLFWPGVRTPQKPFAVLDERLDVLPFGSIKWHKQSVRDSQADSLFYREFHPNWCLTVFTVHDKAIEAVEVRQSGEDSFAISWSTPVPANSIVQYWPHDLAEIEPRIETIEDPDLVHNHHVTIDLAHSEIRNPKSEMVLFRVLSFDAAGRLYRSRTAALPTGRVNWALGCTAFVSKRFPFKEFKYASNPDGWLDAYHREPRQWNMLKPPHELTDGRGLRAAVEPWIRHAEDDPAYVHWIAIDLGGVRVVDEVLIAHDPGWISAGYRIEAGPGDVAWSAAMAGEASEAWTVLLAEEIANRAAVARHRFACRRTRWIRILYTHPAPVGLSANRIALWEIEVRGPT